MNHKVYIMFIAHSHNEPMTKKNLLITIHVSKKQDQTKLQNSLILMFILNNMSINEVNEICGE